MKYAFTDVETTGTDPSRHFAWDIAIIIREPGLADAEYQWYIKPDLSTADPMALSIGRYYERTSGLVAPGSRLKAPKWADPVKTSAFIARLLDGAVLVGQNSWFDAAFISGLLRANDHVLTCDYHYQNLGSLAKGWLCAQGRHAEARSLRLSDLARAAGLDLAAYERHSALGDARLDRDLWDAVTGGLL